jgi:hypothetical protein
MQCNKRNDNAIQFPRTVLLRAYNMFFLIVLVFSKNLFTTIVYKYGIIIYVPRRLKTYCQTFDTKLSNFKLPSM